MSKLPLPVGFPKLFEEIKARIRLAQTRAMQAVNAELVQVYWDIGRMIASRQHEEGWGAGVIPRLARELRNDMPEVKGFSERNIGRMIAFYREYGNPSDFLPQAAAKLTAPRNLPQLAANLEASPKVQQLAAQLPSSILWSIPWFHHVVLMSKVKDLSTRLWYMQQTLANGWSRSVLLTMSRSTNSRAPCRRASGPLCRRWKRSRPNCPKKSEPSLR